MKWKNSIALLVFCFGLSCSDNTMPNCAEPIACTKEFVTLSIRVMEGETAAGGLLVKTLNYQGEEIFSTIVQNTDGSYILITDGQVNELSSGNNRLQFVGYKNGVRLFSEAYVVYYDCCHVSLVDGPETIFING